MTKKLTALTLSILLTAFFSLPVLAGDTGAEVFSGELTEVDLSAQTLVVQNAEGEQMKFTFNQETDITGTSGAQGLTGETGSSVKVHYQKQDSGNMATRIEIQKAE